MKAVIVGYGKSGKSAAQLLNKNYEIVVYDDKRSVDTRPYKNIKGKDIFEEIQDADLMVVSPGVSDDESIIMCAKKCGIEIISEIELAYKFYDKNIISVTGTNGKTTTIMLINKILENAKLKSKAVGNIGNPFSSIINQDVDYAAVELSSFQLEKIKDFNSHIAICLNITEDHLQRHKTMENYIKAKLNIFKNQSKNDYAIINYDDNILQNNAKNLNSQVLYISGEKRVYGAFFDDEYLYINLKSPIKIIKSTQMAMKGKHNMYNALAAILACYLSGVSIDIIQETLKYFKAPSYRIEFVGRIKGKSVFNDSKSTNVDSTIKACEAMDKSTTLIIGGYNKGMKFEKLFLSLPKNIKNIVICGANTNQILSEIKNYENIKYDVAKNLKEAIEISFLKNNDAILFSPGTSSFDKYSSYIERGEDFNKILQGLFNC